jgi:hypothetical protein
MDNITRKMTLILAASILLVISGCTGMNSTNGTTESPPTGSSGPFIKGAWMDHTFVQKLKEHDFNSVWSSLDNATGFTTFRNEDGTPHWLATIPDTGGDLDFRDGKWYQGDSPIVEFFVEGKDTLAKYFVTSPTSNGKGGLDNPRIYVRVPCAKNPNSHNGDDWYISEDCVYFVYYFSGNYDVIDTMGVHSTVELSPDGTIKGNRMWNWYGVNTVNTLPILYLVEGDTGNGFVIKANGSGFSLAKVMNTEDLEGDGNEIVQGPHVFDFVRTK